MFTVVKPSIDCSSASAGEALIDLSSSPDSDLLSSEMTQLTGCGTADWPWLINAGHGQRLNITMYDFSREALATTLPPYVRYAHFIQVFRHNYS